MSRDRSIDAVRAIAIAGVVLGHWLVTGLVLAPDGGLAQASPLRALPWLTPATWLLQTLGLFFFAAGYAAARSRSRPVSQLRRLAVPVVGFAALWLVVLLFAAVAGAPETTLRTVAKLVVSPLWFLLPYAVLVALVGPVRWAVRRCGLAVAVPAVAAVVAADAGFGALPVTVVAAWLVPYVLGVALATGRLDGRRTGAALAAGGVAAMAVLVLELGYPASAVGVPGAGESNLYPPSLFTVALATAQVGVALLARPWLNRRPPAGAVTALNRVALPVYLWHQSALVAVAGAAAWLSSGAPLPGLHTAPDGAGWLVMRLAWLPAFAVLLAAACRLAGQHTPAGRPNVSSGCPRCTMTDGSEPGRPTEVIAVRDSDPPSRGRVDRQLS